VDDDMMLIFLSLHPPPTGHIAGAIAACAVGPTNIGAAPNLGPIPFSPQQSRCAITGDDRQAGVDLAAQCVLHSARRCFKSP
jgi:hypothetical protein